MSFSYPWLLCLLCIPLALAIWEIRRRGFSVRVPFDFAAQPDNQALRYVLKVASLLPTALLAMAIILAAGPRRSAFRAVDLEMTNIVFLLDVSGSMMENLGKQSRYEVAMKSINNFMDYRKGDSFSLCVFGSDAFTWIPLTQDLSAIRCATPFLVPAKMPPNMKGTNFAPALDLARQTLSNQKEGDRLVIMITDGFSADINGEPGRSLAARLQADHIKVYAVLAFDGKVEPNFDRLVHSTGGEIYQANDPKTVESVMRQIDSMHPTRFKPAGIVLEDFMRPFAAVGILALALYSLSLLGLRYTPW